MQVISIKGVTEGVPAQTIDFEVKIPKKPDTFRDWFGTDSDRNIFSSGFFISLVVIFIIVILILIVLWVINKDKNKRSY